MFPAIGKERRRGLDYIRMKKPGMLPLALGIGAGSQLLQPLAIRGNRRCDLDDIVSCGYPCSIHCIEGARAITESPAKKEKRA